MPLTLPGLRTQPQRVLVVDDHVATVESMALILQAAGFATLQAFDGETALDLIGFLWPDVAILDVALPRMTGLDLARELRARSTMHRLRIVCISGLELEGDRLAALRDGLIDAYLVKPISPPSLIQVITG